MDRGTQKVSARVVATLARGGTVLTGSRRLARAVRWGLEPSAASLQGQREPRVFAWRAWTAGLWHRALLGGATDRMLLNRSQEEAIWRELIEREPAVASLRSPRGLARLARAAWGGLAQHRGLGRLAGSATNADTEAFVRLAAGFDERCRRDGYLSEARLEGALRQAMRAGGLVAEDTALLVYGFDRLLPAQEALLEAVREAGIGVEVLPPEAFAEKRYLYCAEDEAAEMRSAAQWARGLLEQNPAARIGVLAAGLAGERSVGARIGRVLREVLAPEAAGIGVEAASLPYEIGCSGPLAGTALVADALDVLAWAVGPLALDRVGRLLLSRHLGAAGEEGARAEFDAFELRRAQLLRPEVSLDWLVTRLVRSSRRERLGRLIDGLRGTREVMRREFGPGERKAWGGWAEAVRELLAAAGWASAPPADAAEFETRRGWESVLDELATLDFEGGRVSFAEALSTLRSLAEETEHAAPVREAAVQVMTPEEAAGLRFDAVWMMGAGDLSWPGAVGGSALLGWPLRRELGMPGSDHAADQAYARRVTERIAGSAATVIFSYAGEAAGGRQRPSPALCGLGLEPLERMAVEVRPALVELEAVNEDGRIAPPPEGRVPGGAAVLQAQAACGFRAFAQHRLGASELEGREPGMNAKERGIAVHRVLERFWEVVQTQTALREMTAEERDGRLAESIEWAIAGALRDAEGAWDGAYLETQRRRLMTLGRRWLVHEAERAVPFRVVQRETKVEDVTVGPLHLTLRVDRIDETQRGAVLIDYKTGEVSAAGWLGDRPDEPQLPLYALLAREGPLHAVAFGKVVAGKKMEFVGYEEGAWGTLKKPGEPPAGSLDAQRDEWRGVLTGLATDVWEGDARVTPKVYPKTCEYCAQRLLCRLDVAALADDVEEEDVEEADGDEADRLG